MSSKLFTDNQTAELRRALRTMEESAPTGPDYDDAPFLSQPLKAPKRPVWSSWWVAVGGLTVTLAFLTPLALLNMDGDQGSVGSTPGAGWEEPTIPEDQLEEAGPVPREVRAYWALEGTLESVGAEPGWLCPSRPNTGYSFVLDAADLPAELVFEMPGHSPVSSGIRDMGPTCEQPPALVLLAFVDDSQLEANAGVSVWPSLTRFEDVCPPGSCSMEGSDAEGRTQPPEELTIHNRPALLIQYQGNYELWWEDSSGVPLYGVFSGVSREEVVMLAEGTSFDPMNHAASHPTNLPAELEVVERGPSVGVWAPTLSHGNTYEIDGTRVHVSARWADALGHASTPYTRFTSNVTFVDLVDLGDRVGVWVPEGGNFLFFETDDGVKVTVEGAASKEEAINIALALEFPTSSG